MLRSLIFDLGRAAAHLDVVVVEDLPELAVELDGDALLQVAGRDHGCSRSLGAGVGSDVRRWVRCGGAGDSGPAAAERDDAGSVPERPRQPPTTVTSRGNAVSRSQRPGAGSNSHEVLDAHARLAVEVDARLDAEHRRRRQGHAPAARRPSDGSSCVARPMPCPRPWPKWSPCPAAVMTSRAAASMARLSGCSPARRGRRERVERRLLRLRAPARRWPRSRGVGSPTNSVRVMSER